jgi:hypothetical protein
MLSKPLLYLVCLFILLPQLNACSSIARGVTEGLMANQGNEDEQFESICVIRGPAFEGLAALLEQQSKAGASRSTKVLMVHGIGKHLPGYSARLQDNLTAALGLNVVQSNFKEFTIIPPPNAMVDIGDKPLGNLRIYRYFNDDGSRELLFYELTWSQIVQDQKAILAYDDSEEYAYRRATLNRVAKSFFNNAIPDPIIYTGDTQLRIMSAVVQSLCWVYSGDWNALPDGGTAHCNPFAEDLPRHVRQDSVSIITHSLGSRITMDALQTMAQYGARLRAKAAPLGQALQDAEIPIYMLANQLPLLQLGFSDPTVTNAIPAYCLPDGEHYDQRMFKRIRIVAFSDPNDILSYAITPEFAEEYINSQLCPEVINVTLNVAPVTTVPVVGDFANPLEAHSNYAVDPRVIGLIVDGISKSHQAEAVRTSCTWRETRP